MTAQTVLVIEDDFNTSNLVRLYLEREGFRVLSAGDLIHISVTLPTTQSRNEVDPS